MMIPEHLEKFKQVLRAGVNLIPIGSKKKPTLDRWKIYQTKRVSEKQLEKFRELIAAG